MQHCSAVGRPQAHLRRATGLQVARRRPGQVVEAEVHVVQGTPACQAMGVG
jgi:hypothetical protein